MQTSVSMQTRVQIGTQNGESLPRLAAGRTGPTSRTQSEQAARPTASGQPGESRKTTGAQGAALAARAIRQVAVGTGWFFKAAGEILVTNIAGGALTFLAGCYANSWLSYAGVPTGSLMEGGLHALLTYKIPDMLEQGGRRMLHWLRGSPAHQDPLLQQMEAEQAALRAEQSALRRALRQDTSYRALIAVTESRQSPDGSEVLADSQRPAAEPQQDKSCGRSPRKGRNDAGQFPQPQSPMTRGRSTRSSAGGQS